MRFHWRTAFAIILAVGGVALLSGGASLEGGVVNDQAIASGDYTTVMDLLNKNDLDPRLVVVELNGKILPEANFASATLKDGDTVEIVQFVAGG